MDLSGLTRPLMPDALELRTILATDCGSTTTKAILIERKDGQYRLIARGEAPTTVEAPAEDVTRGVINAVEEIEDLTGRRFTRGDGIWLPRDGDNGCDVAHLAARACEHDHR